MGNSDRVGGRPTYLQRSTTSHPRSNRPNSSCVLYMLFQIFPGSRSQHELQGLQCTYTLKHTLQWWTQIKSNLIKLGFISVWSKLTLHSVWSYTRENKKKDNGKKLKQKNCSTESVKSRVGRYPMGSPVGGRGSVVGRISGKRVSWVEWKRVGVVDGESGGIKFHPHRP